MGSQSDTCFTRFFLKKYPLVSDETIDALITNGYSDKEFLLLLDVNTDLPLIAIPMAQKSVLRKILVEFQSLEPKTFDKSFHKKVSEDVHEIIAQLVPNNTPNKSLDSSTAAQEVMTTIISTASPSQSPLNTTSPTRSHSLLSMPSTSGHMSANSVPPKPNTSHNRFLSVPSTSRQSLSPMMKSRTRPLIGPKSRIMALKNRHKRRPVKTCEMGCGTRYVLKSSLIGQEFVKRLAAESQTSIVVSDEPLVKEESTDTTRDSILRETEDNNTTAILSPTAVNSEEVTSEDKNKSNLETDTEVDEEVNHLEDTECERNTKTKKKRLLSPQKSPTKSSQEAERDYIYSCLFADCDMKFCDCNELLVHRMSHESAKTIIQKMSEPKKETKDVNEQQIRPVFSSERKITRSVTKREAESKESQEMNTNLQELSVKKDVVTDSKDFFSSLLTNFETNVDKNYDYLKRKLFADDNSSDEKPSVVKSDESQTSSESFDCKPTSSESSVDMNNRRIKCRFNDCEEVLETKRQLMKHIKLKHFKKCDFENCGQYFAYESELIDHKNSAHPGDPPEPSPAKASPKPELQMTLRKRNSGYTIFNDCTNNSNGGDDQSLPPAIIGVPTK